LPLKWWNVGFAGMWVETRRWFSARKSFNKESFFVGFGR